MTLTRTIPSYAYWQYSDDDDIQAFVAAFNEMAQEYVDWFNEIQLPVYTNAGLSGALLDWVIEGIYGLTRPSLPLGHSLQIGALNTYAFNTIAFNDGNLETAGASPGDPNYYAASDDTFRRILTWHFFKGDGKVFDIRWLKRRVMRFLYGTNGVNFNVDQTYQISVTFGVGNQVNIRIITQIRTFTRTAAFNRFGFNTTPFNGFQTTSVQLPPVPNAAILASAIQSGVLELPFQFSYVVIA